MPMKISRVILLHFFLDGAPDYAPSGWLSDY
jgi:hypothetical protein